MCKYFTATDHFAVETTQDMDPFRQLVPGAGRKSGVMKAHVTVYEPGDEAHPSLPTLREFITKNVDPATGILTFDAPGHLRLSMDPAPLRELPAEYLDYRVSPGCTFVTRDALTRAKARDRRLEMHEAADAIFQPTADELRRRAEPLTEIVARDDRLLSLGPLLDHPWSSQVHWVHWTDDEAESRITEVLEFFRRRRQAFVWLVTAKSTPGSLGERLAARGLTRELEGRMLAGALPIVGLPVNPQIRVDEVTSRPQMLAALRVDHPTWDDQRLSPLLEDRMRRVGTDWHAAVAYLEGRPVGTARWFIHRDLRGVEFVGAETLVDYRRRGVYSTLVQYRLDRAAREDCTFAGIIADGSTSAPILLKRGFEDLGRATFFLRPAQSA